MKRLSFDERFHLSVLGEQRNARRRERRKFLRYASERGWTVLDKNGKRLPPDTPRMTRPLNKSP